MISISASEDRWLTHAADASIEAARKLFQEPGGIPPGFPIGSLSNFEWGKLVAAILFGWINVRAQQATREGFDTERTIREIALDPPPWDVGMVIAILPKLAESCPNINWSKPLGAWGKEELASFLLKALQLIDRGRIARDTNEGGVMRQSSAEDIARQTRRRISF